MTLFSYLYNSYWFDEVEIEGAKKEVKRASKFYAASAAKRKQEN